MTNDQCQITEFGQPADIYVINTCTVTEDADRKSRQVIRRALRSAKKVIVTGCYAKLQKESLLRLFPDIEFTNVEETFRFPSNGSLNTSSTSRVRVNLMIQDGCEHYCSYCIVPLARGKVKSKPVEEVITEAGRLAAAGAREIILTGINLGAYQHDLRKVIRRLSSIENLLRIRLSSIEPMYLTKELIDAVAETPKVCHHLHIPLQSGDNSILKAMNRSYTRDDYLELIHYIRKKMPDCGVTTDVIVGFPGEGDKEFQNTVDLINQIKFSRLHVFPYSKRKGTPAADLPNQVNAEIKKKRNHFLHEIRTNLMKEFAQQYLGEEVEILVEQKGEGLTPNYIRVLYSGNEAEVGSLIKVVVKEAKKERDPPL